MSDTHWITFNIARHGNADARYQALLGAVRRLTEQAWWTLGATFMVFRSDREIDDIAEAVAGAIDPTVDVALVAKEDPPEARAIGAVQDPMLFELMPYAQRFDPPPPVQPDNPVAD